MISASTSENFKNINRVSIIESSKVFYPLKYVLQKRNIEFDDDDALIIENLLPEDLKYPAIIKQTDAGMLREYKIDLSINNQNSHTQEQLEQYDGKNVIVVLHHQSGKIIFGCNEMPLIFYFNDENTSNPSSDNGFTVICSGKSYYLKVSV